MFSVRRQFVSSQESNPNSSLISFFSVDKIHFRQSWQVWERTFKFFFLYFEAFTRSPRLFHFQLTSLVLFYFYFFPFAQFSWNISLQRRSVYFQFGLRVMNFYYCKFNFHFGHAHTRDIFTCTNFCLLCDPQDIFPSSAHWTPNLIQFFTTFFWLPSLLRFSKKFFRLSKLIAACL